MKKSQNIVLISFLIFCVGVFVTALLLTGNPYKNNQLKEQIKKYKNINSVKSDIENKYRKNKNILPKTFIPEERYEGITYKFISKGIFELCIDEVISYDLYEKKRRVLDLPYLSYDQRKHLKEGINCFKYEMEKVHNWPKALLIEPKYVYEPIIFDGPK